MLFDEFIKCKLKLLKFLLIVFYGRARFSFDAWIYMQYDCGCVGISRDDSLFRWVGNGVGTGVEAGAGQW